MDQIVSILEWIGANEAILSGVAATIVIVGVLFTPLGRGVRTLFRRRGVSQADDSAVEAAKGDHPPMVSDRPSIAVMPFANLSAEAEHEFLADGLTEDIIVGLSRVKHFFVIARNTSFTYKNSSADVQLVSRELGVRYVLEGSVRRLGDRIRVTAQLVDAKTRGPIWAEQFDRRVSEILVVDDEVTEAIVAALQPALRSAEADQARRAAPEDLNAWALVNRAWVSVQSDLGSVEAAEQAIRSCEEALVLDSEYGFAHAVLGHARSLLVDRPGAGVQRDDCTASLQRALALAPDDPLVHHCQAAMFGNLGRTPEAVRSWERALELDPNSAGARAGLGIAQIYLQDSDSAVPNIEMALRLSPRDPLTYHWLACRALACLVLGRWEEGLEAARDSVARKASRIGYATLAAALVHLGSLDEARDAFAHFEEQAPGTDAAALARMAAAVSPNEVTSKSIFDALMRASEL